LRRLMSGLPVSVVSVMVVLVEPVVERGEAFGI
jgi:hypothetical protein